MSSAEQQSLSGIAVDVDHNPYLAEGAGTVDAIVSIAVGNEMVADRPPERVEAIIIDCSTSMLSPAGQVRGSQAGHRPQRSTKWSTAPTSPSSPALKRREAVYPEDGEPDAGKRGDQGGGRACRRQPATQRRNGDRYLARATSDEIAGQHPGALTHAILLTDGKDEHETPEKLRRGNRASAKANSPVTAAESAPTWRVEELRAISSALLGTVDIVADPADLVDDFAAMMRASMGKSIPDLTLRLWTPAGATVAFVKQVAPTVEDLTERRVDAGSQMRRIPAGRVGPRRARLPHPGRGRTGGGRAREARRARDRRRRRRHPRRGPGEGDVDHRHRAVGPDQPPGRALHRPGGARAGRAGRAGCPQERRRRYRDCEAAAAQWNSPWSPATTARQAARRR